LRPEAISPAWRSVYDFFSVFHLPLQNIFFELHFLLAVNNKYFTLLNKNAFADVFKPALDGAPACPRPLLTWGERSEGLRAREQKKLPRKRFFYCVYQ